tara:strand:- start:10712 stop:11815 length:1104 start_codon:yes stop_codon:yes gene_type:complete
MAYIEPHPTNKRKHRIRWYDHQNNSKSCITFTGTKKEAEKECQYWARKEQQIKNGFMPERINMVATLKSLEEWFFSVGLKWKNNKREVPLDHKTVYIYEKSLSQFSNVFGKDSLVSSISSTKYREYYSERKLNGLNVDIRAMITIINTAMNHRDRLVTEKPTELFTFNVKHSTPFYLEYNQVDDILSCDINKYYKNKPWDFDRDETMKIFMLYLHTGCRLNELLSLTWDNVSFAEKSIVVTGKRKKVRKIFMTDVSMEILMTLTERSRPMPYTSYKVRQRLNDLNKLSKIRFTTHNLRSTCGSFMLSAGCSIEEVSEHLGHDDIQTTRKWYARIIEKERKSATRKMQNLTQSMSIKSNKLGKYPILN